jgi:hypothetical protein
MQTRFCRALISIILGGAFAASGRFAIADSGREARSQIEEGAGASKPVDGEISQTLNPSTSRTSSGYSSRIIHVKFREGTSVDAPETLLPVTLRESVVSVTRLFSLPERKLENIRGSGETRTGKTLPDLNLWFQITLKPDVDAASFLDEIKRLNIVESAQPAPVPAPAPAK